MAQSKRKYFQPVLNHVPFPEDDPGRVAWLLDHVRARPHGGIIDGQFSTSENNAAVICKWMGVLLERKVDCRPNGLQYCIQVDSGVIRWLEEEARKLGSFADCRFCISLEAARAIVKERQRVLDSNRAALIRQLEERDGRKGCFGCGSTELLEFFNPDPSNRKVHISVLLHGGKFALAQTEAMKCQLRCLPCHRKQSVTTSRGPPRLPLSANTSKNLRRARDRGYRAKKSELGKKRKQERRLAIGKCSDCALACTIENHTAFDFDHRDPHTKKFDVSQISHCALAFETEVAKCDLVCAACHIKRTAAQRSLGLIADKFRETKKRKQTENMS
jgi:hypothetical protein